MDILQSLPIENWVSLRDELKRDWPTYSCYYYWVNNAMKWKKKDPKINLEIYCPNGDYKSGVFFGIFKDLIYIVTVFTFDENKQLFWKVLEETKVIEWTRHIIFTAVHQYFRDDILNFIKERGQAKNMQLEFSTTTNFYFKTKEECAKQIIKIPDGCELRNLDESHIPLVHSEWPHRSEDHPEASMKYLTNFVRLNRGVGLFLKKDNSLVSWILHTDWGSLGQLQTLNEHKCKGYGKIVTQAITKDLAVEENLDSILYIVENNTPSEKLFESLGYERRTTATWIGTKPVA